MVEFKEYGVEIHIEKLVLYPAIIRVGDGSWLINFLFWSWRI